MEIEQEITNTQDLDQLLSEIHVIKDQILSSLDYLSSLLGRIDILDYHNEIYSILMTVCAKTFEKAKERMIKPHQMDKLTPFRSNLLEMNDILKKISLMEEDVKKRSIQQFLVNYWMICDCECFCHCRVSVEIAFKTFERYCSMDKKAKSRNIGSLLLNFSNSIQDKQSFSYSLGGTKICKAFFMHTHSIKEKALKRIQKICKDLRGEEIKDNQNFEQRWSSHFKVDDKVFDCMKVFLKSKIEEWCLPNPSIGPEFFLPSNFSWKENWRNFCQAFKKEFEVESDPISWTSFYKYYTTEFDYTKKLKKKTDYCSECCVLHTILKSNSVLQIEKQEAKLKLELHLNAAANARSHYNQKKAETNDIKVLSFDYAENILIPYLIDEPGIFYFKTRRKVGLFGINDDKSNIQCNFLLDECCMISKGPDSVISMLHYYLTKHISNKPKLVLFADNCPGQNKNQTMIGYLTYLVKVLKLFPSIELYFLVSGHTKFSPDQHFGRIKNCIKSTDCLSIIDLVGQNGRIQKSALNNFEILYKDPINSTVNFRWYNWKKFISTYFLPCPGISNWHVIKIIEEGDFIYVGEKIDGEVREMKVMNSTVPIGAFPEEIFPEGLNESRQRELEFFKKFVVDHHVEFISKNY
jgi:hypothetical protein